jgi:predicted ATP-grasp superfamily ATP-dependent carboligase
VARSLGRRGIPVVVIDDQPCVASVSRYVTETVRVPDLLDEQRAIQSSVDGGRRVGLDGWVLFPTRDETVAAISRHRDVLDRLFRVTTPEWGAVQWAWDKQKSYALARRLGIPCPMTFTATSAADLDSLAGRLPLAIKPAIKEQFFYATGDKAWRANTLDELRQAYNRARHLIDPAHILIQEIIPGGGDTQVSYCAFYRDGQPHGVLTARRERQHPREFGRAATYVETSDVPEIEPLAERFLRAIDHYGLVEIEFKRDPRDGEYKLLDVNARTWGFHILGAAAGVDYPYLAFADQTGSPLPSLRARAGVGWLRLIADLPTAVGHLVRRDFGLRHYFASLRRTRVESVFASDDVLPFFAELAMLPGMLSRAAGARQPGRPANDTRPMTSLASSATESDPSGATATRTGLA